MPEPSKEPLIPEEKKPDLNEIQTAELTRINVGSHLKTPERLRPKEEKPPKMKASEE